MHDQKKHGPMPSLKPLIIAYLLAVQSVIITVFAVAFIKSLDSLYLQSITAAGLGLLVLAMGMTSLTCFCLGVYRWTVSTANQQLLSDLDKRQQETHRLMRLMHGQMLMGDAAKRIVFRDSDRETTRKAIREDIARGELNLALSNVKQMIQFYGNHEEAEEFREQIQAARATEMDAKVAAAIEKLDETLAQKQWDTAANEAAKIQRKFPDSVRVEHLNQRVIDAKENHKHKLEQQFLQEAQRENVDVAISLLRELDTYLTEEEAAPFRETARGVIGRQRENLGMQFKLAVQDKEWAASVQVGEQIIREFPNSKMAGEVRGMLEVLRERATGEQAARPNAPHSMN